MSNSNSDPLVSIVVPVRNQVQLITPYVEALFNQDYRNIEVILVDDGSDDSTLDRIYALAEQYQNVRAFFQTHLGVSAAREIGRLNAQGEFVLYQRASVIPHRTMVTRLVAMFREFPQSSMVVGSRSAPFRINPERIVQGAPMLISHLFARMTEPPDAALFRRSKLDSLGPWLSLSVDTAWEYVVRVARHELAVSYVIEDPSELLISRSNPEANIQFANTEHLKEFAILTARVCQHVLAFNDNENSSGFVPEDKLQALSDSLFDLCCLYVEKSLSSEARAMLNLSIEVRGKPSVRHRLFIKVTRLFGWQPAVNVCGRSRSFF